MAKERVQKIIASVGLCSRRTAEEWIADGLVTINGKVANLGDKADLGEDAIKVKGKLLQSTETEEKVYVAFHKPKGVISMVAEDPEGRPTLKGFFKKLKARLFPIGRLEYNQEGLILLTNDGSFAEKFRIHPKILRIYKIKVSGHANPEQLALLQKGMRMEGRIVEAHSVRILQKLARKTLLEVSFEGMGAIDIREFMMRRGFLIDRLVLNSIGQITLDGLEAGEYRLLKKSQLDALLDHPELGAKLISEERTFRDGDRMTDDEDGPEREAVMDKPLRGRSVIRRRAAEDTGSDESPKRDFGDRPKRDFGDRPKRDFGDRPKRDFGDRPKRDFGDRPKRDFGDRPKRDFGDRPKRDFGDRPKRDFGDRPKRDFGDRPFAGERPARRIFGADRGTGSSRGAEARPFRPRSEGFNDRPRFGEGASDRPRRTLTRASSSETRAPSRSLTRSGGPSTGLRLRRREPK